MIECTAFLINDMLLECSKTGTAKRLNSLPFSVCSKTGTVGKPNSTKNLLAYNISYTPEYTILSVIQGENLNENINGSITNWRRPNAAPAKKPYLAPNQYPIKQMKSMDNNVTEPPIGIFQSFR